MQSHRAVQPHSLVTAQLYSSAAMQPYPKFAKNAENGYSFCNIGYRGIQYRCFFGPIGEEEDSHLGDFIPDNDAPAPADAASHTMLREQLSDVLSTLTKEPYTAALFADELFVSKATIRTDIEKANQSLEADHIKIYQTTGRGIEIKGKALPI